MQITTLDHIGFYGPLISMVYGIFLLSSRIKIAGFYIGFMILGDGINRILKSIFRESRPANPLFYSDLDNYTEVSFHRYGMPSGHAQAVCYSASYLYMITRSIPVLFATGFIAGITMIQRYKFRKHTAKQLLVGSAIGLIYGAGIAYYLQCPTIFFSG